MAKLIAKPATTEEMLVWHIDSEFEKNSTFKYEGPRCKYVIVQENEVIGVTDGKLRGSLDKKLCKKHFSNLKCGFLSKKVKANIYYLKDNFDFKRGKADLTIYNGKTQYGFYVCFNSKFTVADPAKVYKTFIRETRSPFYTKKAFEELYKAVVDAACKVVAPTLSFPPVDRCTISSNYPMSPEAKEFMEKIKPLIIAEFEDLGYKVTLEPGYKLY